MIFVEINGEPKQIPADLNVRTLLDFLSIDAQRVAVELNRTIVRKADWENVMIEPDSKLEVVMFVGGGAH